MIKINNNNSRTSTVDTNIISQSSGCLFKFAHCNISYIKLISHIIRKKECVNIHVYDTWTHVYGVF